MNILVFGNGWLGRPLREKLEQIGHLVIGTQRSASEDSKIAVYPAPLFRPNLPTIDVIVLAFTPNRSSLEAYANDCLATLNYISPETRVLMISSTSVFKDGPFTLSESDTAHLKEENSIAIAEQALRNVLDQRLRIIRMGGLVGPNRYPVTAMIKTGKVYDALSPCNLIHLDDAIGICISAIESSQFPALIHAVAPDHPTKEVFYTYMALKLGLIPPLFDAHLPINKEITTAFPEAYFYKRAALTDFL